MAYRKPFTPQQRREAIAAYRSYRKHFAYLRRTYRPVNPEQTRLFRQYRDAIDEIAVLLQSADRTVDVEELNRADLWARMLATEYWRLRGNM